MRRVLTRSFFLLAIASTGVALADCGNDAVMTISDIEGKWVLVSINGEPVESDREIYFSIDGRTLSGFDGCNTFGGSLDNPEYLRMTQRSCPDDTPRLPLDLKAPLAQLESAELDGDVIEIALPDDKGIARLRRSDAS